MDQGTDRIEEYIENTRRDLGSNLDELEERIGLATDWLYQYQLRPMAFLALAFGGGLLLGRKSGRRG